MIYLFSRYNFYTIHNIITDPSLHKTWRDASREELYQKRQKRISNVTIVKKYYHLLKIIKNMYLKISSVEGIYTSPTKSTHPIIPSHGSHYIGGTTHTTAALVPVPSHLSSAFTPSLPSASKSNPVCLTNHSRLILPTATLP